MKNNIKFMITFLVLLSSLSSVGITQAQDNDWQPKTGDMILYDIYNEYGDARMSHLELYSNSDNSLLSYSENWDRQENSIEGDAMVQVIGMEYLTQFPYIEDIENEMPDDVFPYGLSISFEGEQEGYWEQEKSLYRVEGNEPADWDNHTDYWEDDRYFENQNFEIAAATEDFFYTPEFFNPEGLVPFEETQTYEIDVCLWGDCSWDWENSQWITINVTETTIFDIGMDEEENVELYEFVRMVEGEQSGLMTISVDNYYDSNSPLVNVTYDLMYQEIYSEMYAYDRSNTDLYGMYLGSFSESGYATMVNVTADDTIVYSESEDCDGNLDIHCEDVSVNGMQINANYYSEGLDFVEFMPTQGSSGVSEGLQVGDELHYVHNQYQTMYNEMTQINPENPAESQTDEMDGWLSMTSDVYFSVYATDDSSVSLVMQELFTMEGIELGGDLSEPEGLLDEHDGEDPGVMYQVNIWENALNTSASQEMSWEFQESMEYNCFDFEQFDGDGGPEDSYALDDNHDDDDYDDDYDDDLDDEDMMMGLCFPPMLWLLGMSGELDDMEGDMPLLNTTNSVDYYSIGVNNYTYALLANAVTHDYGLSLSGEFEMESDFFGEPPEDEGEMSLDDGHDVVEMPNATISYTLIMSAYDYRAYDQVTGTLVEFHTFTAMELLLDIKMVDPSSGVEMVIMSTEGYYSYLDSYYLGGHSANYLEAQDPNSVPEDPNANVNETTQVTNDTSITEINGTEIPPDANSLLAGLPGFGGFYAMIALSVSIVFSRKIKRN